MNTHYSAVGNTVNALIKKLENLKKQGFGASEVVTWDPETDSWKPITGLTYGPEKPTKLYCDDHP